MSLFSYRRKLMDSDLTITALVVVLMVVVRKISELFDLIKNLFSL